MKITIKDVAKEAGVSPSTVSRVISDSSRISEETKTKVRKTMKKLGYFPNAIARSLVNRITKTIGVVMPHSTETALLNPFYPLALSGISASAHKEGFCLLLSTGETEEEQLKSIKNIVMSGRVDGVIIMYSSIDNKILNLLRKYNIQVLIVGKPMNDKGILFVDNDNVKASYDVTQEFIKRGNKRIGFISGKFEYIVSIDRLDGYKNALIENNIEFNKEYVVAVDFLKDEGYLAMKKLLKLRDRPTAIVVTDDSIAFGAIEALKDEEVRIPEDVEIISFNNIPLSRFVTPTLSSVDINAYELGYKSSELIIDRIKNENKFNTNNIIVSTKLIHRESSRKAI